MKNKIQYKIKWKIRYNETKKKKYLNKTEKQTSSTEASSEV